LLLYFFFSASQHHQPGSQANVAKIRFLAKIRFIAVKIQKRAVEIQKAVEFKNPS
jgi:hypothetical protein